MIATVSYMVASAVGAQITPYALIATAFADFVTMKAFSDWMKSRAMAKADFVPVGVPKEQMDAEEDVEDMAMSAEEVEEKYGQ